MSRRTRRTSRNRCNQPPPSPTPLPTRVRITIEVAARVIVDLIGRR